MEAPPPIHNEENAPAFDEAAVLETKTIMPSLSGYALAHKVNAVASLFRSRGFLIKSHPKVSPQDVQNVLAGTTIADLNGFQRQVAKKIGKAAPKQLTAWRKICVTVFGATQTGPVLFSGEQTGGRSKKGMLPITDRDLSYLGVNNEVF